MNNKFLKCLLFIILFSSTLCISDAKTSPLISGTPQILNNTSHYSSNPPPLLLFENPLLGIDLRSLIAGILSFVAAAISSAGGIGGGGLFIPILTVIAGLDVKTASTYSSFMVTGGSIANVATYMLSRNRAKRQIDYDVVLLCQPSLLLGVSCGVVLNVVFPSWLITVLFVGFVTFCTFKTCRSGVKYWSLESRELNGIENGEGGESTKVPLLSRVEEGEEGETKAETPWVSIGMLLVIWLSFFGFYLLHGNHYAEAIIQIEACGTWYWIISFLQIPLAILFTSWIIIRGKASTRQEIGGLTRKTMMFPIMALLAGLLGGIFGIGGGMLISPILLQIGIDPQVTAVTCSFMVLMSSSMSALQFLLMGMKQIQSALTFAAICFVASLVGLTVIHQAISRYGRPSLIVFSVGTVMALSIVFMTSFGALDIWNSYISGEGMGFKKLC